MPACSMQIILNCEWLLHDVLFCRVVSNGTATSCRRSLQTQWTCFFWRLGFWHWDECTERSLKMSKYKVTRDRIAPFMVRPCDCFAVASAFFGSSLDVPRRSGSAMKLTNLLLSYHLYYQTPDGGFCAVWGLVQTWGGVALVFVFLDLAHAWYVNQRTKHALLLRHHYWKLM